MFVDMSYGAAWLAFGDMRGKIEPCGCNPQSNLGGVGRLYELIRQERLKDKEILVLNLGGNFSEEKSIEDMFIRKSLAFIQPDVVLDRLNQKPVGQFVLHSNTKNYNAFRKDGTVFIGLLGAYEISKELIEKQVQGAQNRVLLYHGSDEVLKKILDFKIFNTVITSHTASLSEEADGREKKEESLLQRLQGGAHMVPLAVQGVLRSDKQDFTNPLMLKENKEKVLLFDEKPKFSWEKNIFISWLDKSFAIESDIKKILDDYQKSSSQDFVMKEKKRMKEFEKTLYLGSDACASCHQNAFKVWKKSAHATAFETLQRIDRHHEDDCVSCHVTGWNDGGYVSEKKTNHLKGVQCENCHGPGKDHVLNRKKMAAPNHTCVSCHKGQHSPDFQMNDYWPKIKHGF